MSDRTIRHRQIFSDGALNSSPLSGGELMKALGTFGAELSTQRVPHSIREEMKQLHEHLLSLDNNFSNVSQLLEKVASESRDTNMRTDVKALAARWDGHRKVCLMYSLSLFRQFTLFVLDVCQPFVGFSGPRWQSRGDSCRRVQRLYALNLTTLFLLL